MRWLLPTCMLAITLVALPAAAAEARREMSRRDFDPSAWRTVEIVNPRGQVVVRPSADGKAHLEALKILKGSRERADALSRSTQVETSVEGGRFVLRVRYPQRNEVRIGFWDLFSDFELPQVEVRLALEMPAGLPLSMESSSGDLTTEDLTGSQSLETHSGDVAVRGSRGPLDIQTGSGDVELEDVAGARLRSGSGDQQVQDARGALECHTGSGDITVTGVSDTVEVDCASGDVTVEGARRWLRASSASGNLQVGRCAGKVELSSSSGDVEVELASPLARCQVNTASGGINLRLAGDVGCALDAETISGTIDLTLPVQLTKVGRHAIIGVVRRGTAPVVLRSSSGDIEVTGGGGGK